MALDLSADVIRSAQNGDGDAQRTIITLFTRPIHVTVSRLLHTQHLSDIEDCVQDIFLKLMAHLRDFDFGRGVKFSTWLYTFVRNHCFDRTKKKRLPTTSLTGPDGEDRSGEWLGVANSPEALLEQREFTLALARALNELAPDLRQIFLCREVEGLEFHQIARRLSVPLGTVKSKHYRALDRLRFLLRSFRLTEVDADLAAEFGDEPPRRPARAAA